MTRSLLEIEQPGL